MENHVRRMLQVPMRRWAVGAVLVFGMAAGGCNSEGRDGADRAQGYGPGEKPSAMQVLRDMAAAYRNADSYSDRGQVRFRFQRGEENVDETADFSVTLERPNKIRLNSYQATVVSDGSQLRAAIADLDGQVLVRDAPGELTLETVFVDDVLNSVLTEGISGGSPQLILLLGDDALDAILQEATEPILLEPETVDTHPCFRVQMSRPDGKLIFWIDQQTLALRRIDYPIDALREQLAADAQVDQLALWAEFPDARFNAPVDDDAFQFQPAADAKLVTQFDTRSLVPPPPPPSPLLGQTIGDFEFVGLDGTRHTRNSLAGKTVVIDFWATWCQPCMQSLPALEQVYQRFRDREDVVFLAISIDQSSVKDEQLAEMFDKLGVQIPIARDNSQFARDVFQVEGIPNTYILGDDGTVQDNEVGVNPDLAVELTQRLEKLLAGQPIHQDVGTRYEQRKAEFEQAMREPPPSQAPNPRPAAKVEIAAPSEPQKLTREPLWSCNELERPGNILVTQNPADGFERLVVIDGWKRVAEINSDGVVDVKRDLVVPASAVVSYLRSGVDSEGKRYYAGSAGMQSQLHVFDGDWKHLFSLPDNQDHEIGDIQFADLDGDGDPALLVGFWGNSGTQAFDLQGQRQWSNDTMQNVFRLAALDGAEPERRLLCANSRGTLVSLDADGRRGPEISVRGRFIRLLAAADLDSDGRVELCGLSPTPEGRDVAVGFDAEGQELWSYELPAGAHQQPIEQITPAPWKLDGASSWLLAGADGSIHILRPDGSLIDRFHHGVELTGLAGLQIDGRPTLVIAGGDKVEAWTVGLAEAAQ